MIWADASCLYSVSAHPVGISVGCTVVLPQVAGGRGNVVEERLASSSRRCPRHQVSPPSVVVWMQNVCIPVFLLGAMFFSVFVPFSCFGRLWIGNRYRHAKSWDANTHRVESLVQDRDSLQGQLSVLQEEVARLKEEGLRDKERLRIVEEECTYLRQSKRETKNQALFFENKCLGLEAEIHDWLWRSSPFFWFLLFLSTYI